MFNENFNYIFYEKILFINKNQMSKKQKLSKEELEILQSYQKKFLKNSKNFFRFFSNLTGGTLWI